MIKIKEAILVEGKYDKNTLSQIIDTDIFESGGFRIFNDKSRIEFLRHIANTRGLILFLDSDGAGFVIRNRLKSCIQSGNLLQAYIPEVVGKEKRKRKPGKAGLLGVEGMQPEIIIAAIKQCGAHVLGDSADDNRCSQLTRNDLFRLGITGQTNSRILRDYVKFRLQLPSNLGTTALLSALNLTTNMSELESIVNEYNSSGTHNL